MSTWTQFNMTTRHPRLPALLILLALTTTSWTANGCGNNMPPQPFTLNVRLEPAFDRTGTLRSDVAYTTITANNTVNVGDNAGTGNAMTSNLALRGFVSVLLDPIPPTAEVTKVLLHLEGNAPFGNPFGDFGTLTVDHVNILAGITKDNFLGNTITSTIATIPPLPTAGSTMIVELDVTTYVKADIAAGRPISSFRLLFSNAPTVDDQFDVVFFNAFPDDPTQQPFATATIQP